MCRPYIIDTNNPEGMQLLNGRTDKDIPVYPTLCEWGIKKFVQIRLK